MRWTSKRDRNQLGLGVLIALGVAFTTAMGGCEKKEKVLDIKAPGVDIEVNKTSSGTREVEINSNDKKKIEIDTK